MKTCLIISGGDFAMLPEETKYDYCIACDKGYEYAEKMGIKPDLILGDFDSSKEPEGLGVLVCKYPVEKDDTDTMLAIKQAIKEGCEHIVLGCCLGGRFDHTMANIQSMAYAASNGCVCELYGDGEWMRTVIPSDGRVTLHRRDGWSLSLFSLSDSCENLSIEGAKYNVTNVCLTNEFPLGHGNSWIDDEISISIESGILLLIESEMGTD